MKLSCLIFFRQFLEHSLDFKFKLLAVVATVGIEIESL